MQGNGESQSGSKPRESVPRRLLSLITNYMVSRASWIRGGELDRRRDIADECGWLDHEDVGAETYQRLYNRFAIAARVVQVFPKECWQVTPNVFETEDPKTITPFEKAWRELGSQIRGKSFHNREKGSVVWNILKLADIICGIGRYGVILLGLDDGRPLSEPAPFVGEGKQVQRKLLFTRVLSEVAATIAEVDTDMRSYRFGQPLSYNITMGVQTSGFGNTVEVKQQKVHWTRVIHVIDNAESSVVYGVPRMEQVLNNLQDLRKLYGGSAEMYWNGAFPGISFETDPALGGDVDIDTEATKDQVEKYFNGLQRFLALTGMTAKSLAPQVVDPTPQIERQIEAICIKGGYPKRIFMGSERGELASSQDDAAWNDRLRERQNTQITPNVIVPFVDRLILLGVLPPPALGYTVEWPDLTSQTSQEKTQIAFQRTQALAQYATSGAEQVMPLMQYLTLVFGLTEDEAIEVVNLREANRANMDRQAKIDGGVIQ